MNLQDRKCIEVCCTPPVFLPEKSPESRKLLIVRINHGATVQPWAVAKLHLI
jgi:hypothetical protein